MKLLENTFSWSPSRDASFRRCAREYWWNYYGSWKGWDSDAPPEARAAYVLKNLSTRWAWVGTVVHDTIERTLRYLARGLPGGDEETLDFGGGRLDVEEEIEAMTRRMRAQWVESRSARYRLQPKKRFGLLEHEYGETVPDAEWKAMSEKAREALRAFLTSPLFARIRGTDPRTWFPIEELGQFEFEGVPVWAVLDFAMRRPDGGADIFDWKTGIPSPEANRLQLACYVLFVQAQHGIEPAKTESHLVYLGRETKILDFVVSPKEIDEARHAVRESIAAMRSRLQDAPRNVAAREAFPMTDDLSKCALCAFRRLCQRG